MLAWVPAAFLIGSQFVCWIVSDFYGPSDGLVTVANRLFTVGIALVVIVPLGIIGTRQEDSGLYF